MRFTALSKGSVSSKTPQVAGSDIYTEMVTRNVTDHTYTTNVDGTSIPLYYMARTSPGTLIQAGSIGLGMRQPKGMTLQTSEGPKQVHTVPKH